MSKTLVAFFSASGVTRQVAQKLAAAAQADLYEIKPAVPYTQADLNWRDKSSRSSVEMQNLAIRPQLADTDAKIEQYDRILLGYPIWWYMAPTIINTFLESYDFSGKSIILFATSGGSGFGKSVKEEQRTGQTKLCWEKHILNRGAVAQKDSGGMQMYTTMVLAALCRMIYLALHVTGSSSFPKPLSREEEEECLARIEQGDVEAKNKLIEHNLRLVAHIIKKYYASYRDQEDLISIGTIGLIKAASSFNSGKGTKFATYASRCIENEILMYFRQKKKSMQDVSISDPIDVDKDGNSITLMDIVQGDENILDSIDLSIQSQKLYHFIEHNLEPREQKILAYRYGLYNLRPMPQREVAKKLNISRSYVSRIEKKALEKLKGYFEEPGGENRY